MNQDSNNFTPSSPYRVTTVPPRGTKGRFLKRAQVAEFTYWKADSGNTVRHVAVVPHSSIGNYLSGIDLDRKDYRTFRRSSIVGDIQVKQGYLDTVTKEAFLGASVGKVEAVEA